MILTDKQKEFVKNANARFNLKVGARRCGKTHLDVYYRIAQKVISLKDEDGLNVIMGVSRETIERNVLKPMREIYTGELIGTINSRNIASLFGVDVYCLGAEKVNQVSKIQGTSIKYAYCDELARFNKDVFETLKGSLDKEYSTLDGALNPESNNHWLKKTFLDRIEEDGLNVYVQHYTIYDNPFLPQVFVENFVKEMKSAGSFWYNRLVMGEWCNAEGLVYPMFDFTTHVAETKEREYIQYSVSMDYGIQNPTSIGLWGLCDGVWYRVKEYYHGGRETGQQKTDAEYYEELKKLVGDCKIKHIIIDPSAASFIALIKRKAEYSVKKANNEVLEGINNTATAIREKRIMFNDCCKRCIDEFGAYIWDTKSLEDKPVKENDHAMDDVRYFVNTEKVYKERAVWRF